jgi:hypothetical protein
MVLREGTMKSRWAWALGVLLLAGAASSVLADEVKKKGDGGSSGGRSESAGARHHSGGSSGSSSRSSGGEVRSGGGGGERSSSIGSQRESSGSRGRSSRAADDPPVRRVSGAEARHPEAGTGHGWRVGRYGYYSSSPYYYSRYPSRSYYWYRPYYWGWYGVPYYDFYWDSGYYSGGGYYRDGYYRDNYRYRETGSIRTLVDPERTKVYVDGYYAGTVDDFDGMFQRLYVAPGRHDISFKLDGYRTHVVKVFVTADHTVKIRHDMAKGMGEDSVEDLTGGRQDEPYRMSADRPDRDDAAMRREDERRDARDSGTLRLEVQPSDASIYVDGEFYGNARRSSSLTLAPGRHRIEVVRPGYRTVEREIEVRPGRSESVAIDLERN